MLTAASDRVLLTDCSAFGTVFFAFKISGSFFECLENKRQEEQFLIQYKLAQRCASWYVLCLFCFVEGIFFTNENLLLAIFK